jgi:AAHS family benzoate transporter-like MFS transporter
MSATPATTATGQAVARSAGWVAALCWIAVLLDGFDLVVVGTVIPALISPDEWALSGSGATAVITLGLVGMMLGALGIGMLTDRVGRRKTLIGSVASFSFFTLLCAFAPNATVSGCCGSSPGWAWAAACRPLSPWSMNSPARAGAAGPRRR